MNKREGLPKGIVIHHSLTKDGKVEDYAGIKRYHIEEKKWDDIGYHFVIEQSGDKVAIITGRPADMIGAHCEGHNDMIGICVVGNYDVGFETLSQEKMNELVALVKNLFSMYGLGPTDVFKHSRFAPKTCPGNNFPWYDFMHNIS